MKFEFMSNKKALISISSILKAQTYLFPRLHSSAMLLVKELMRDSKHFFKNFESFFKVLLEDAIFNEEILEAMKSVARMKFLHIGFKITEAILKEIVAMPET